VVARRVAERENRGRSSDGYDRRTPIDA
jgi:hypothetical protein